MNDKCATPPIKATDYLFNLRSELTFRIALLLYLGRSTLRAVAPPTVISIGVPLLVCA